MKKILIILLICMGGLFFCPNFSHGEAAAKGDIIHKSPRNDLTALPHVENQILVKFKDKVSVATIAAAHAETQATIVKRFNIVRNLHLVRLSTGMSVQKAIESYRKNRDVLYAEPNYIVKALMIPNDPFFSSLWALQNTGQEGGVPDADIDATEAWNITTGNNNVVVAVIDTGVDYNHEDLNANILRNTSDCNSNGVDDDGNVYVDDCYGIDTINYDSDPMDDNNHGTHVAGIIGAIGNNSLGVVGINWNVSIMACKFLDSEGSGSTADAIQCLEYVQLMKDRGVNIVATNNSWGGAGFSQALFDAIYEHMKRGILFIAAAGNSNNDNDFYTAFPASYYLPNIIAVAATDRSDNKAFFSNSGKTSVHIGAPGQEILSTTMANTYSMFSGTSMAAPYGSGVAALLKAHDPGRDWITIRNLLISSGDPLSSLRDTISQRRLNVYRALTCIDSVLLKRLWPSENALFGLVGSPVNLAEVHVNCGAGGGNVEVIVTPGGEHIILQDDGQGFDLVAGDGIYSGTWTPTSEGVFTLTFPNSDIVAVRVFAGQNPPLFRPFVSHDIEGVIMEAVAIGDINADGKNDVVVTTFSCGDSENDHHIHVFLQDSLGELSPPVKYRVVDAEAWSNIKSVDIGDLNSDGKNDIAVSNYDPISPENNFIGVFLQDKSGNLSPVITYPSLNTERLKIGDLNNDGRNDIVSAAAHGSIVQLSIFHQTSGGDLSPSVICDVSFGDVVNTVALDIRDMNNDGLNDIVVVGGLFGIVSYLPRIAVLHQSTGGNFELPIYLSVRPTGNLGAIATGDIDNDMLPDIVIPYGGNRYTDYSPYIGTFHQGTSGMLGPEISLPTHDGPGAVRIANIDADGRNDIIVTHGGWMSVGVHLQAPNGSFFPYMLFSAPAQNFNPQSMAVGDINSDGRNDIVTTDVNYGLSILYNDPQSTPITPTLVILKGGNGLGTVISDPAGINCGENCQGFFNEGTYVKLTAIPTSGSTFEGWRGKECWFNRDGTCTVVARLNWAIQADFILKSVRLTVNKSGIGSGTVTSSPPGIYCGADCTEDYDSYRTVVLTATPDPDSVFAGWSGRIGNFAVACPGIDPCAVRMDADGTVTATFNKKDQIMTLHAPNGGEVIPSGSIYIISWEAPSEAINFKLTYSLDNGLTWFPIPKTADFITGTSYDWSVPKPWGNKKNTCLVKVKGYDASGNKIGVDISDAPFTIEVMKVTSPTGGETLIPGTSHKITWLTHCTKSDAAKVKLYYTKNGGVTWNPICDHSTGKCALSGNPGSYDWTVPTVGKTKNDCKVKVELKDDLGNILGTDKSDGYFTIQP